MNPFEEPFSVREIWPPETIIKGDYSIQRKLGQGGFGTVYLAKHRFLGTIHVIKRLHEHFASNPEYVRKFVKEARAVRRLKGCLNIVEVEHMTRSEDGHLILVMEHIAGGDLGGLMESRRLSAEEVIEFGRQIACGLEAAHAAGLVHRDIKPENIMISHNSTGQMVLKLIDFGIVADHAGEQQTSIMHGGSIGYAALEQWGKSGKELDGRTDLYSLGASMYRMLCGRMPYPATDIGDWIEKVRAGPPVVPSAIRNDVPQALSDLILELLALRPEGRPADAATVIRRLDAIRAGGPMPIAVTPEPVHEQSHVEKTISSSEAVTEQMSGAYPRTEVLSSSEMAAPPPPPVRRTVVESRPPAADAAVEVAAPAFGASTQTSPRYPIWALAGAFVVLASAGIWLATPSHQDSPVAVPQQHPPARGSGLPAPTAPPRGAVVPKIPDSKPKTGALKIMKEPAPTTYTGPKDGRIVWIGDLEPGQDLDLGGSTASVSGKLPGVPVKFEIHPASLSVVQPPDPANQWRRLVVHNDGKKLVAVVVTWTLTP